MDNPVGHGDGLPERQEDEQRGSCSSLACCFILHNHTYSLRSKIKETTLILGIFTRKDKCKKYIIKTFSERNVSADLLGSIE